MGELNTDNITALYQAVSRNYNLGTYDQFSQKMVDPANRKSLYDQIKKDYDLGNYSDFENRLVKKKESSPSPSNEQVSTPTSTSNTNGIFKNPEILQNYINLGQTQDATLPESIQEAEAPKSVFQDLRGIHTNIAVQPTLPKDQLSLIDKGQLIGKDKIEAQQNALTQLYDEKKLQLNKFFDDSFNIDKEKGIFLEKDYSLLKGNILPVMEKNIFMKPIRSNEDASYLQGVPKSLLQAFSHELKRVQKFMNNIDEALGFVPGFLWSASQMSNPNQMKKAITQYAYAMAPKGELKNELGQKTIEERNKSRENVPIGKLANDLESWSKPFKDMPNDMAGQFLNGLTDFVPLMTEMALTPEVKVSLGGVKIMSKLGPLMAIKGYNKAAEESKQPTFIGKEVEAFKGMGLGLLEGMSMEALGLTSKTLGKYVGDLKNNALLEGSTAAVANSLGFGGYTAAMDYAKDGKIDKRNIILNAGLGLALSVHDIARGARERAINHLFNTSNEAIRLANSIPKTPEELRKASNDLAEKAFKTNDPNERGSLLAAKNAIDNILTIQAGTKDVVNNSEDLKDIISRNPELSKETETKLLNKIDLIKADNEPIIQNKEKLLEENKQINPKQTQTPPTEIKVGDMTLTGEDAQAYQDLVDKYGKDKADYMMGITEPKYNQTTGTDTEAKQANQNIIESQKKATEQQPVQETTQPTEQKPVETQPTEITQPENKPQEQINQGGQENATQKGKITENNQQQYQGTAQGENVPENTSQVRQSESGPSSSSNSNERSGQVAKENIPKETNQKALTLENAKSVNELQQLLSEGKIKYNDPTYLKKLEIARKNDWIDPEDVKQENDLRKVIENDSAKNKPPEAAGSSGKNSRTIKENVTSEPKDKINFKKYFTKERGLPKSVFSEKVKKEGAVKGLLYRANLVAKDALQAAKDVYKTKKLSDQQAGLISDVLENMGIEPKQRQEWLNNLPESLRPHIENMRDMIDRLTGEIQKTGILSPDNEMKFDQNTGFYLTRSYRKFRDPNYNWNNISDEVKVAAGKALKQYYPDASNDKILGILKNIVEDKSFGSFIAGEQPLGKMNLSITKNRSVFLTDNPEIRNLMGEIRDPFVNFAISTAKMTELAERAKFLNNVTDIGLREGWLKPDIEGEFRTPIGVHKIIGFDFNGPKFSKSGKSLSPLNEYYTTPEIADAFKSFNDGPRITNWFVKLYMRGVTETKLANTAFSIGSQARNFQSNGINLIANGAWNVHEIIPEFKKLAKSKEAWRNFMQELKTNSIVGDNVETQAMLKNIEQLSGYMDRIYNEESPIKKGITNSRRFFLDMYSLGDDVFKAYRYISEYTRYQKVYEKRGMAPEDALNEAKQTAKQILHDTQTYYSNIPAFMDYLRVLPFSGSFITFPYLTMVNVKNTAVLAAKEMASPDTFKIGLQRGSGLIAGLSGLAILSWMRNRSQGLDSQDMGDIRKGLASYWKNDNITIKKVLGNGKFIYSNTSYLDFYNSVTTPVLSIIHAFGNKGKLTFQDFMNSVQEFLNPYTDNEIMAQRIMNTIQNYDKDTKQPIYNEALPEEQQNLEKIKYLFGAIVPATIKDIDRTIQIAKRDGNWKSFAIGRATGRQTRELDLGRSFSKYMVPIYKDHLDNAIKIYRDLYYDKTKSPEEKEKARQTASEQLNKYVQELHDSYNSFKRQGASAEEMNKALSFGYGGFPMKRILRMAIIDGNEVEIDQDGNIMFKKK